jgi:hypothetical protein
MRPDHPLRERFDKSPLKTVLATEKFVRTRASYVSQTSLYGYLKTRMGTQFRALFEDEVFSGAIRISAGKLFASCLSDLTVFATAHVVCGGGLEPRAASALATHIYKSGLGEGLEDIDPDERPAGTEVTFGDRVASLDWTQMVEGRAAFLGSEGDLIRFAPVIDQYKKLDGEIVTNSIRFRWTDVRSQLRKRIDVASVARDWSEEGREERAAPAA